MISMTCMCGPGREDADGAECAAADGFEWCADRFPDPDFEPGCEGCDDVCGEFGPEACFDDAMGFGEEYDCGAGFDIEDPHELGRLGEELACAYLRRRGFSILQRNYRTVFGEADIVCCDPDGAVSLVEVKTRRGDGVYPELAVDAKKRSRYRKITLQYINDHDDADCVSFDVVAVNVTGPARAKIHHIVGICEWDS